MSGHVTLSTRPPTFSRAANNDIPMVDRHGERAEAEREREREAAEFLKELVSLLDALRASRERPANAALLSLLAATRIHHEERSRVKLQLEGETRENRSEGIDVTDDHRG